MDKKTLYYVIPVAVTIVVGAFAVSGNMIDYYCSPNSVFLGLNLSTNVYCPALVLLTHIIVGSAVLILGMVVLPSFLYQKTKVGIEKRTLQIASRREQQKIMSLTKEELRNNRIDLRIHNNEESFILLKNVFVDDDGDGRSRVSVEPVVRVEAGKSQTTSFITEDAASKSLQYLIIGHHDNGATTNSICGKGIRVFNVVIVYDSDEKKVMGLIKRFRVTVNYKAEKDFDIEIEDADK